MTNENSEIISQTAVNLITELFKISLKGVNSFANWIKDSNTKYDPIGIAADKYVMKLQNRYSEVRIIGMSKPVQLRNIYVKVNILDSKSSIQVLSVKQLEEIFYKEGKIKSITGDFDEKETNDKVTSEEEESNRIKYVRKTVPGIDVVNKEDRIFLIGKPGAGKTTFLKYLILATLDGKLTYSKIPIYISLKELSDSKIEIFSFIIEQFEICDFPNSTLFVEHILKEGNCIILFDGLDEASEGSNEIINKLNKFIDKYLNNKFVISCRVAASNYVFEKFTEVEISDFDENQIKQFIDNWFIDDKTKARLCWSQLSSEENKSIMELSSTPLLLTLICISFESTLSFPVNKAEVYKEALDVLLKKWDSSRNIKREDIYKELSLRKKETLLSQIAFKTFSQGDYFFQKKTIENHIQEFILNLNHINENEIEFDSQKILMSIEAQHGLIVERAKGIFSFSHLTLQEYFTAKYFVDNLMKDSVTNIIHENIINNKWKEVLLISAGMLNEADEFLIKMQNQIMHKYIETEMISFLQQVYTIIRDDPFFPIEIRRCLAIYYVLDLDFIREKAKHSSIKLTRIRSNVLSLTNAISKSYSKKVKFSPVISLWEHISDDDMKRFVHDLNKAIRFDCDLVKSKGSSMIINSNLIDKLDNYIQSCKTLIDCLNSDSYITNENRAIIHNKLLDEKYIS